MRIKIKKLKNNENYYNQLMLHENLNFSTIETMESD
jgi:hypothetical protein